MNHPLPTILLVDDDEVTRRILQRWLAHLQARLQVAEAADGEQALDYVQAFCKTKPAAHSLLVLLDLKMPVMDGQEFLEHQRQLPSACRRSMTVIALTGTLNHAEQNQARSLATEVRAKPLDLAQLRALIEQYLPAAFS